MIRMKKPGNIWENNIIKKSYWKGLLGSGMSCKMLNHEKHNKS